MNQVIEFISKNWKAVLIGAAVLFVVWAFTPSCATRRGREAEAIAALNAANIHKEIGDAAKKEALRETEIRKAIQVERDQLHQEKVALTEQVARLRKALPPRPVVGPGNGVPGSGPQLVVGGVEIPESCRPLVEQLYDTVDAQAALIAKHEEDDRKEAEFIASLQRSEAKWKEAALAREKETEELRRALRAKDIQLDAMKWSNLKSNARAGIISVAAWEIAKALLLRRK